MKVISREDSLFFVREKPNGRTGHIELRSLINLADWQLLTDQMINYCVGKADATISTWFNRIMSSISIVIDDMELKRLPVNSVQWELFIRTWYGVLITSKELKSSLETRVAAWNKSIVPFLDYLQMRDLIPSDVIIPQMKSVGQRVNNSSFDINLIGESKPIKVPANESINKILAPISLSRTDAEYLDELFYDLEKNRNKLYECFFNYWKTIKEHYEFGKKCLGSVDEKNIKNRIKNNDFYILTKSSSKKAPPRRQHFAKPSNLDGFCILLFLLKSEIGQTPSTFSNIKFLPAKNIYRGNAEFLNSILPTLYIEDMTSIKINERINWCLGCLSNRDVSYITALLIMLNPKFTFESLLNCEVKDKDGKKWLETSEYGYTFSIEKSRAKSRKTETLDDLSFEIITTIMEMNEYKLPKLDSASHNRLFLVASKIFKCHSVPNLSKVVAWLTGSGGSRANRNRTLIDFYPSIAEYGLHDGTLSHTKIRKSEGVLEWFRTGSIKAASRKLGNTKKVALEYYIPKELIAAFNTRQIRRFQNLLIVASTSGEDYMLDAVDFNTIDEVHSFIINLIESSNGNSNPLIKFLKQNITNELDDVNNNGELIASISKQTLTTLYVYKHSALKNNISAEVLSKVDKKIGVSPLSFINLSGHLDQILSCHADTEFRTANNDAIKASKKYIKNINWGELIIKKSVIA